MSDVITRVREALDNLDGRPSTIEIENSRGQKEIFPISYEGDGLYIEKIPADIDVLYLPEYKFLDVKIEGIPAILQTKEDDDQAQSQ